jgi:transcriptional regulator with XRE-family HTH domain
MALTDFGKAVQKLRIQHGVSQKDMAAAMKMGSTYLSALEHGERTLNDDHIQRAVGFWAEIASAEEIAELRRAAAGTTKVLDTSQVEPELRILVAKFARRLQQGKRPSGAVLDWIETEPASLEGGM